MGLASGASAATVFSGSTGGTFTDPGSNACTYSGGSGVAWGEAGGCPDFNGNDAHSRMFISNFNFSESVEGTETVQIGQISWRNNPNLSNTGTIRTKINLDLDIDGEASASEFMRGKVANTTNPSGDSFTGFSFDDFGLSLPLELLSGLSLEGFSFGFATNAVNGGLELDWFNSERNTSTLAIYATVSEISPVPLPAAGWMLIAAVGGLGAMRRKQKAA
jgi:hypothetical protein